METLTLLKNYFTVCGIVGFIDKNRVLKNDDLGGLLDYLIRRGSDNQSFETYEDDLGKDILGHSRLKIIDLPDFANQLIPSNTSPLMIILNGEIYNYKSLQAIWHSTIHTRLVNDYLVKVDKTSMFHSLEVRSPLLDKDLFEHVIQYNPDQLLKNSTNKFILKKIAEKYIPKEVLYRQKMGFAIPIGEWFRSELKNQFIDVVMSSTQNIIKINYEFIEQLFEKHLEGEDHNHKLSALYVFHKWLDQWKVNFNLNTYY